MRIGVVRFAVSVSVLACFALSEGGASAGDGIDDDACCPSDGTRVRKAFAARVFGLTVVGRGAAAVVAAVLDTCAGLALGCRAAAVAVHQALDAPLLVIAEGLGPNASVAGVHIPTTVRPPAAGTSRLPDAGHDASANVRALPILRARSASHTLWNALVLIAAHASAALAVCHAAGAAVDRGRLHAVGGVGVAVLTCITTGDLVETRSSGRLDELMVKPLISMGMNSIHCPGWNFFWN